MRRASKETQRPGTAENLLILGRNVRNQERMYYVVRYINYGTHCTTEAKPVHIQRTYPPPLNKLPYRRRRNRQGPEAHPGPFEQLLK